MVFHRKNIKISGFSAFPVSSQVIAIVIYCSKESLSNKTTFKTRKNLRRPEENSEIDEMTIWPYTKCMGPIFGRKFLST